MSSKAGGKAGSKSGDQRRVPFILLAASLFVVAIAAKTTRADETLAERRARIAAMPPEEKEQLRRRFERFNQLGADQQDKLRALHQAIEADAQRDQLLLAMARYHDWLKELTPAERARLQQAPPEERMAEVRKLRREQQDQMIKNAGWNLSPEDVAAIQAWMLDYAKRRRETITAELNDEQRRWIFSDEQHAEGRLRDFAFRRVFEFRMNRPPTPEGEPNEAADRLPPLDDAELADLAQRLSPEARKNWNVARSREDKERLIVNWVRVAYRGRFGGRWGFGGRMPQQDDLKRYFDDLPQTDRERLLSLPHDEMQRALRGMYFRDQRNRRGSGPDRDRDGRRGRGDERPDDTRRGDNSRGDGPRGDKGRPNNDRDRQRDEGPRQPPPPPDFKPPDVRPPEPTP